MSVTGVSVHTVRARCYCRGGHTRARGSLLTLAPAWPDLHGPRPKLHKAPRLPHSQSGRTLVGRVHFGEGPLAEAYQGRSRERGTEMPGSEPPQRSTLQRQPCRRNSSDYVLTLEGLVLLRCSRLQVCIQFPRL